MNKNSNDWWISKSISDEVEYYQRARYRTWASLTTKDAISAPSSKMTVLGNLRERIAKYEIKTKQRIRGIIFSNEGARGRTPLIDVSEGYTKSYFAYENFKNKDYLDITAPEPGVEVKAPRDMSLFFKQVWNENLKCNILANFEYLDVTHLDVSDTTIFEACFSDFGLGCNSKIVGLEKWNMKKARNLNLMFCDAFEFNHEVKLDLSSWEISNVKEFECTFHNFAKKAKTVELKGIEQWKPAKAIWFTGMFSGFAQASTCQLDLNEWSQYTKKHSKPYEFAANTFFRIKEPEWAN